MVLDCGEGCLFNVSSDPEERVDLANSMGEVVTRMRERLNALAKDFFTNNDTGVDACPAAELPVGVPCACWMGRHKYHDVLGPFQEVSPPYSG